MKLNMNVRVKIKQEVLSRRHDLDHYKGMTGLIDATGDSVSTCSVVWGDRSNGWRSFHNTSDLENV